MKAIRPLTAAAFIALVAFAAGCSKEPAPAATTAPVAAPKPVVSMPTTNDSAAWKAYFQQELPAHMDRRFRRPYTYFIPMVDATAADAKEQQDVFDRQLETVEGAVARGIQTGTLIAFGGPDPVKVGDVIQQSFQLAGPKSLKGVRVVVITPESERARITAAVAPTEAELIFVDPK